MPMCAQATWLVEESGAPGAHQSEWRALYSAVITLTLGVLGSTVLPVPYAFSQTGIFIGCLTMALVAFCNVRTCFMMVRAASHTGLDTYEALAEWAAGPRFRVLTQVSLIVLLYGTMCGGLAFLSDTSQVMVEKGFGSAAPDLLRNDGRPLLVAITLLVLLPLCLQRHIRQIETAATFGFGVVVALCTIIVAKAVNTGFPAVHDGELPLFSMRVDRKVFEAFAVLGFAFYVQPMLMPLCKEMPAGRTGVVLIEHATRFTLYGVACLTYGVVGIFGAAVYGQHTESNILVNDLVTGAWQCLALYIALILYLCVGMVTTHYALRASLDILLFGPNKPFTWSRQVLLTCGSLGASLAVAMLFPKAAEKIFALTGCSAVCIVCYVVPCVIDIKLLHHLDTLDHHHTGQAVAQAQEDGLASAPLLEPLLSSASSPPPPTHVHTGQYVLPHTHTHTHGGGSASHSHSHGPGEEAGGTGGHCGAGAVGHGSAPPWRSLWGRVGALHRELLMPCLLVGVGVSFSLAGLYVAVGDALRQQ